MPQLTILVDGTIPVAEDMNGNWRRLNQAIGVSTAIANYAPGDILYASATDTLSRLPIGNPGDQLTTLSGFPAWSGSAAVSGTWQQRNLQGTLTTAVLTVTADSVMLRNSALGVKVHESVTSVAIDPSTAGLNGRDQTAAFSAGTDLYAYWISNGTTIRGVWADSAPPLGPDLSTLAAFAGYTYWAPIIVARWGVASTFTAADVRGNKVYFQSQQVLISGAGTGAEESLSIAALVPSTGVLDMLAAMEFVTAAQPALRVRTGVNYWAPSDAVAVNGIGSVWMPYVGSSIFYFSVTGNQRKVLLHAYTVANGGA